MHTRREENDASVNVVKCEIWVSENEIPRAERGRQKNKVSWKETKKRDIKYT